MKILFSRASLIFSLLFLWGALYSQVPDGGTLLNSQTSPGYQKIGSCTVTEVSVSDQDFTKALRATTPANVTNTWDAQIKFASAAGIETNDIVLVAFYARTISSQEETGEGGLKVCIEYNSSPYDKQLYYHITIGHEWKEYYASVKCNSTLAAGSINYAFHLGYPSQTIEVADIRFLNYKNSLLIDDLPITEITYIGQAPDASWRAPAEERINQIRKGQADITVYDEQGVALKDASISIEMVKHQFGFGTAIAASTFNDNATYRNKVFELFNEVVFENDLKWPQFDPSPSNYKLYNAFDTLEAHNIGIRGHNIIWPSFRYCPSYLQELSDDTVALRNSIDRRIDNVTGFTKGRLLDWDVINEPYSEQEIQNILGDPVMADWFRRVRRKDRGVKLYINDYSILSAGGLNKIHQDYYYDVIQYIDDLGGGIEGIGMQGHFSAELTSIPRVYEILERFSALGKDIKITEHDIDLTQRNVQADYTRDFMTILFSHSSVKSLLVWGFWAGRHWKPDGAFFNTDWTIRPHGEVWQDMIYNQWWTPSIDTVSGEDGRVSVEGFLGTYKYTVVSGDSERSGTFTIDNSYQNGLPNTVVISLDESIPEEVEIIPSTPGYLCQGEELTLQAPEGTGLNYTWYRNDTILSEQTSGIITGEDGSYTVKISKGALEFVSSPYQVEVRPVPEAEITATGDLSFCEGNTVTLSANTGNELEYEWFNGNIRYQGVVSSIEAGERGSYTLITTINGCSAKSDPVEVIVSPMSEVLIEALGDTVFCEGDNVLLRTIPVSGMTYTWHNADTILGGEAFWISVSESGSYRISAVYGGCSDTSDVVEVIVYPVPEATISISGELSFCEGNNVSLTANTGEDLTYTWMKGDAVLMATEQSIEIGEEGSYTLVTSNEGCSSSSEPVSVTVLPETDPACVTGIDQDEVIIRAYPNPFHESFNLELNRPALPGSYVEIFDTMGKLAVKNKIEPGSQLLSIFLDAPGFYLLLVNNGGKYHSLRLTAE